MEYVYNFKARSLFNELNKNIKYLLKLKTKSKKKKLLNEVIIEHIEEGLRYGFTEIRYYLNSGSPYHPSIEAECREYFSEEELNERSFESVFNVMKDIIIPRWIEEHKKKYNLENISVNEDEFGKYFEIKVKLNNK